jgi:hypothetical protein
MYKASNLLRPQSLNPAAAPFFIRRSAAAPNVRYSEAVNFLQQSWRPFPCQS